MGHKILVRCFNASNSPCLGGSGVFRDEVLHLRGWRSTVYTLFGKAKCTNNTQYRCCDWGYNASMATTNLEEVGVDLVQLCTT